MTPNLPTPADARNVCCPPAQSAHGLCEEREVLPTSSKALLSKAAQKARAETHTTQRTRPMKQQPQRQQLQKQPKQSRNPNASQQTQRPKQKQTRPDAAVNTFAWGRLGLRVSSAECKEVFLTHLKHALASGGCKLGQEFVAGTNGVGKLLESRNAAVLCVARDAPGCLHNHLVEAAHLTDVPIVVLPKLLAPLAAALGIRRASCFAIARVPLPPVQERRPAKPRSSASKEGKGGKGKKAKRAEDTSLPQDGSANGGDVDDVGDDGAMDIVIDVDDAAGEVKETLGALEEETPEERDRRVAHEAAIKEATRDNLRDYLVSLC